MTSSSIDENPVSLVNNFEFFSGSGSDALPPCLARLGGLLYHTTVGLVPLFRPTLYFKTTRVDTLTKITGNQGLEKSPSWRGLISPPCAHLFLVLCDHYGGPRHLLGQKLALARRADTTLSRGGGGRFPNKAHAAPPKKCPFLMILGSILLK